MDDMGTDAEAIRTSFSSPAALEKFKAWQKWVQQEYLPSVEPAQATPPAALSTDQMTCECIRCTQERHRRGITTAHDTFAEPSSTPDLATMDRYLSRLLPGSLAFNREWSIFIAQRRVAGGEPIDFKRIYWEAYKDRAKRALYADFAATKVSLDDSFRVDALDRSELEGGTSAEEQLVHGWMVISDYARRKGTGPRKARGVMEEVGILQAEIEVRMVPQIVQPTRADYLGDAKPDYRTTRRLAVWAVQAGFGRRMKSRTGVEFDVLSPDGVAWLNARWPKPIEKPKAKRGRPSTLRAEVERLLAEGNTQAEIARLLGKSRQIVSHHVKALSKTA